MCQALASTIHPRPDDLRPPCTHPWDSVEQSVEHGYKCALCDTVLVYCWVCAIAGLYNMHPEPECQNGHMTHIYSNNRARHPAGIV